VKHHIPAPVMGRLRRWRHSAAMLLNGEELQRLRTEWQQALDNRTHELLERGDTVLSGYDRRVAAVATRLLDLEERISSGMAGELEADRVLASHQERRPFTVAPGLYADFSTAALGDDESDGRLAGYVERLRDHHPVVDLGCGRGDLLRLLGEAGVPASGVDANPVLVARAQAAGLDAVADDAFVHLAGRPDISAGAVALLGVVDYLPAADAGRLLAAVRRVVRPGGMVVIETPDPDVRDGMAALWRDPARVRLYHPDALGLLCRDAGLEVVEVARPAAEGSPAYALFACRR